MKLSTTSLVVEHLLGGFLTLFAIYLFVVTGLANIKFGTETPNPMIFTAVVIPISYITGVIMSHFVARLFENEEVKINASVFDYEFPDGGDAFALYFQDIGIRLNLNSTDSKERLKNIERVFGVMRYTLLADGSLQDRLTYYQMMIRVCRNYIIPVFMNALSALYITVNGGVIPVIGYSVAALLLVISVSSYLAMRGYTEWMGYATIRGFVTKNFKQKKDSDTRS